MTRFTAWTAVTLSLWGCGGPEDQAAGPTDLEEVTADQIVYGVRQNMSRDGIRDAILEADSMFLWTDSTFVHVEGMTLTVFDQVGALQATIVAQKGRLNQASSELTAIGNVILTIADGDREVRSEELKFAPETDRIWTDSAVVLTEGDCVAEGTRLQADMSFTDVRIWGTRGEECSTP